MRIALITGASSGMGQEYARLADESERYDEIWAVARREERLAELAKQCTTAVRPFALDLTKRTSVLHLADELERASACAGGDFEVGLLVNAAGFGKFGTYADLTYGEVDDMIDLNCRALVDVTQAALAHMHRGGRILQFASSAGFQPLPGMNVYAASKAFVISYARALRRELSGCGIYVTAVCPIWIRTEFVSVARDTANANAVKHPWPQLSPKRVARWSLLVNRCNYPIATCSVFAFLMRIAAKIVPSPIITTIWEGLRRL